MTAAADRLPRLLALVPWLLAHPGARVSEVAAEFGVGEKQIRDDLQLIFLCGLPGHGPGELMEVEYIGDRVTVGNAETLGRPLRLTVDEGLALIVALRALLEVPALRDPVNRALAKLETAAADAAERSAAVAVVPAAPEDTLAVVQEALAAGRRLHLRYYVPGRDETTDRDVDPMRLCWSEGRPYLEAWCRRAEGVRLFRLDRVLEAGQLAEPASVPEEARTRDLGDGLFQPSADDQLVTLRLAPAARWVADYYRCESVQELPDGGLRVRLRTPDTGWLRRMALQLGAAGRVEEPAELAGQVRADALAALQAYRDPTAHTG